MTTTEDIRIRGPQTWAIEIKLADLPEITAIIESLVTRHAALHTALTEITTPTVHDDHEFVNWVLAKAHAALAADRTAGATA